MKNELTLATLIPYEDLDPRFAKTEYVVEATFAEKYFLWELHSSESLLQKNYKISDLYTPVKWQSDVRGRLLAIGKISINDDKRGIDILRYIDVLFTWHTINEHVIMFYETVSAIQDSLLVDKWLELYCNPKDKNGRRRYTDASNFHSCIAYCIT